jgi:hypothetical protein
MVIEPDFILSTVEYEVVWSALELGGMPYPLQVPSHGVSAEERHKVVQAARDGLRRKGLLRHDRFDAELESVLRVLAEPTMSVDAAGYAGAPLLGLAASNGRSGVLAWLGDGQFAVTRIRPTALTSIVELIPAWPPAAGQAMSVRRDALQQALDSDDADDDPFGAFDDGERSALVRAGVSPRDIDALLHLADQERVAGGQFGVNSAGRRGMRRNPTLVTWFDTGDGRYLMVHRDGWLSLAPADGHRIAARIGELLDVR